MNTLMLVFQTDRGAVSDGETFLFPELSELFWDGGGDSVPRLTGLTYPDGKGLPLAREIVRTSQKWERAYKYMFRDDRLALQILRGREQEQVYLLLEALNERHQSGQLLEGLEALGEAARSGLTLPYSGEETVRAALALLAGQDGTTPDSAREWLRDVIDREDTAGAWTALFFAGRQAFDALAREWDRRGVDEVFRQQVPASFAAGEESDAATLAAWAAEDIGGIRFDVDLMTFDYRGRPFSFKIPAGSTFFNTVTVDGFRPVILDIRIR